MLKRQGIYGVEEKFSSSALGMNVEVKNFFEL